LADSGPEIAAAVGRVVSSAETRARLSAAARAFVVSRYDWTVVSEQLCRIHCDLVRPRQLSSFPKGL